MWYTLVILINSCSENEMATTIDGERFTGINVHGFSPIEVFMEILLCFLGHKCSLFSIIKERHLYSWKNFRGTPENCENHESLAQLIFPVYGMLLLRSL